MVAQKSSRSMMSLSLEALPSSPTIIVLDFLPNGGLASTTSKRSPGSAASASARLARARSSSEPMPCSSRFIAHSARGAVDELHAAEAPSLRQLLLVLGRGSE